MMSLLALNDEVVKVQEMFDDLVSRRKISVQNIWLEYFDNEYIFVTHGAQRRSTPTNEILDWDAPQQPSQPNPAVQPQPQPQQRSNSLLDDLEFLNIGGGPTTTAPYAQPQQPQPQPQQTFTNQPYGFNIAQPPKPSQPLQPYGSQPIYGAQPVQPAYGSQGAQPQQPYKNPFFDSPTTAQPKPAAQPAPAAAANDFDEFDMLAKSRHPTSGPSAPPGTSLVCTYDLLSWFVIYSFSLSIARSPATSSHEARCWNDFLPKRSLDFPFCNFSPRYFFIHGT